LKNSLLIKNEILGMATKHVAHFLYRPGRGALLSNEKEIEGKTARSAL
jgi:hypothetical protein